MDQILSFKKSVRLAGSLVFVYGAIFALTSSTAFAISQAPAANNGFSLRYGASRLMQQEAESATAAPGAAAAPSIPDASNVLPTNDGVESMMTASPTVATPPVTSFPAGSQGAFTLAGSVLADGAAQQFVTGVMYKCAVNDAGVTDGQFTATRNSCDRSNPIYITVNQQVNLPTGYYVLGYENSIFPGFVKITPAAPTRVALQQIAIPAGSVGTYRIYRDTTRLDEQIKIYFTTYVLGAQLFHESDRATFGSDLYIAGQGEIDVNASWNGQLRVCDQHQLTNRQLSIVSNRLCSARGNASFMGMSEFFEFDGAGRSNMYGVTTGGAPSRSPIGRHLVAIPFTSAQAAYINVLPGYYRGEIAAAGGTHAFAIAAQGSTSADGRILGNYGRFPTPASLAIGSHAEIATSTGGPDDDDGGSSQLGAGETCRTAQWWRTEYRSRCASDAADGCNRAHARLCEPMFRNWK